MVGQKNRLVFNVDRGPVEEHLANCRTFVLDWTSRPGRHADQRIVDQLKRIDINVRSRWWKQYKENNPKGRTFTSCMIETRFFADQQ